MDDSRRRRVRWRCRRGMKELDVLLERFANRRFDSLDAAEVADLEHLMEQPDRDILAWLMGEYSPDEEALRRGVAMVQSGMHPAAR